MLPREELKRVKLEHIEKYMPKKEEFMTEKEEQIEAIETEKDEEVKEQ